MASVCKHIMGCDRDESVYIRDRDRLRRIRDYYNSNCCTWQFFKRYGSNRSSINDVTVMGLEGGRGK